MLKKKKRLIFILILSCIFISMSFVSANDNVTNNELHNIDYDNSVVLTNDFNQMNKDKNSNSFNDVQILINNSINNEINLEKDYEYHEGDKPINIHKSIIINGNNHIIDAKNRSKIFNIQADNVIIKNITFMNANGNQENDDYIKIHQMPVDGYDDFKGVVYNSEDFYASVKNLTDNFIFTCFFEDISFNPF